MSAAESPSGQASPAGSVVVHVAGVQKVFDSDRGRHEALRSIDLELYDGEFLTILGPSGCGKTTLLRILAGFEQPTRGEVYLDGKPCTHLPANKRPMAMVFQNYALFPHLTVAGNIAYGLKIERVPRAERQRRIDEVLGVMGLQGLGDRLPGQLSGGQQQRVALARSVVVQPRVLLFDEPLSNLDARLRDQMRGELRRVQQQLGVTSVYVTHDQTEAMAMSDRIVVMSNGEIEQVGTPPEIYRSPASLFVANFIGNAVVLPVESVSRGAGTATLRVYGADVTVETAAADGARLTAVVRPEDVRVVATGTEPPADAIVVDGTVRASEYLGNQSRLQFDVAGGATIESIIAHDAFSGPELIPAIGEVARLALPHQAVRAVTLDDNIDNSRDTNVVDTYPNGVAQEMRE